jgi:hypothetical protein
MSDVSSCIICIIYDGNFRSGSDSSIEWLRLPIEVSSQSLNEYVSSSKYSRAFQFLTPTLHLRGQLEAAVIEPELMTRRMKLLDELDAANNGLENTRAKIVSLNALAC